MHSCSVYPWPPTAFSGAAGGRVEERSRTLGARPERAKYSLWTHSVSDGDEVGKDSDPRRSSPDTYVDSLGNSPTYGGIAAVQSVRVGCITCG